mgnify:CR=1 FL=1|jgi:hypothetical protein|tara:strand:- start:1672 stop:2907 length:1236 start_codon:yes stop_codon:yes gene_type:complete
MKISEIINITGRKKREDRDARKRRMKHGADLYDVDVSKLGESTLLSESRIQHIEDLIFFQGSSGAMRAVAALRSMSGDDHKAVTLKWDGSPAMVFGRDQNGEFIFTDKSGFVAVKTDGKAKSAEQLQDIMLNRSGGINREDPARVAFAKQLSSLFPIYEKAVPTDYRGFFKGDLLYQSTPPVVKKNYVFKPQIVDYAVDVESDLGKRIGASKSGIVIHREEDANGKEGPFTSIEMFNSQQDVLVVPSVTTEQPVEVDTSAIDQLEQIIKKNAAGVDELLNDNTLTTQKMKALPELLYAYMNSKVDTGLTKLGADFPTWIENRKQVSDKMKVKVLEYIGQHKVAFVALWNVVTAVMTTKDDIIGKFDSQGGQVKQSINGQPGGEGYVLANPEGDMKLVPRATFSAANRGAVR